MIISRNTVSIKFHNKLFGSQRLPNFFVEFNTYKNCVWGVGLHTRLWLAELLVEFIIYNINGDDPKSLTSLLLGVSHVKMWCCIYYVWCMYMSICLWVVVLYIRMCMCVYVCMCMCLCACVCVSVSVSLSVYLYVYVCMYICIYLYMYVCMYICVYVCMYEYMYVCMYIYLYKFM